MSFTLFWTCSSRVSLFTGDCFCRDYFQAADCPDGGILIGKVGDNLLTAAYKLSWKTHTFVTSII